MDRRIILFITALSSFMMSFMASAVNVAIPAIGMEFEIDVVLLSWVSNAYLLASGIFLVPVGRIADIYGRKKVFTYGLVIFTLSLICLTISSSSILFILFRISQAIGAAMLAGTVMAILSSVFSATERGQVLGTYLASVYLGLSLGPFLGGSLIQLFGWRSIFLFDVTLGLTAIVLVFWKVKEDWVESEGEKFDYIGSISYGLALTSIMYGLSLLPEFSGGLFILVGSLGFLGFVKWELKEKNPILNIRMFKNNRAFTLSSLASIIFYSGTFALSYILSLFLQSVKGLPPQSAGLFLACPSIMQTLFSPVAGKLSDKFEPRIIASIGLVLDAIGLFLFTLLEGGTPLMFIISFLVLIGLGNAFFPSANTNAIMSSVERRFYGVASGIVGTMRYIGQMLSINITTFIFTLYMGEVQITPEYHSVFLTSIRVTFLIFTVLCIFGISVSLLRGKIRRT